MSYFLEKGINMKNFIKNVKMSAFVAILAAGPVFAIDMEQSCIPANLSTSQLPENGINFWYEENGKHINCNKKIKEAADLASEAYQAYRNPSYFENKTNTIPLLYKGKLEGFVSYRDGKIDIAFRGTDESNSEDIKTDLDAKWVDLDKKKFGFSGHVFHGFYERFNALEDQLHRAIVALNSQNGTALEYKIAGHSLGGATSTLAAAWLKHTFKEHGIKVNLVTFNAPELFDDKAVSGMDKHISKNNYLRVYRENDPVSDGAKGGHAVLLPAVNDGFLFDTQWKPLPNHGHNHNLNQAKGDKIVIGKNKESQSGYFMQAMKKIGGPVVHYAKKAASYFA